MNRFLQLQEELFPADRKKSKGSLVRPQSYYGRMFTKDANTARDYYDWPDKFGKGDASYDTAASAWIADKRTSVPDFTGLVQTKSFLGGYSYNGKPSADPLPDWKETDAVKLRAYNAIRLELFGEGAANSINTYDNQIVTFGWGFSMLNSSGKNVIKYNMESSPDFKNAMLEMGLLIKDGDALYVDTVTRKIVTGTNALQKLRWDKKVLSRIITALDAIKQINVNNQVRILKEFRIRYMPAEAYSWPTDSIRLAMHLYHWLPAYLKWDAIKGSKGDVGTIIKNFCKTFQAADSDGYKKDFEFTSLPNGALYVKNVLSRLDMGNNALPKAGKAGTIKMLEPAAFNETYRNDAGYKDYVFVELSGKIYLIP